MEGADAESAAIESAVGVISFAIELGTAATVGVDGPSINCGLVCGIIYIYNLSAVLPFLLL